MRLYTTLWNINAYITVITNKRFGKIEKNTLQTNIAVNGLYDTRLRGSNTCSLVSYESFIAMFVWSIFSTSPKCLLLLLVFAYIYVSQGSVETHLPRGGKCNNHMIANCLWSVPIKEFWRLVNNWRRYGQK